MSIYASMPGIDDESPCGEPWVYRGSHILPAEGDPRGGAVGLATIPSHITRDGRDDRPEDGRPWPWLRLSVYALDDDPTVILNPAQAQHLADQLTGWADRAQRPGEDEYSYPPGTFGPHVRPCKPLFVRCATPPVPVALIEDERPVTESFREVAASILAAYPIPSPGQDTAETATGARHSDEHPTVRGQSRPGGAFEPQTGAQRRAADVRRAVRAHLGIADGPEADAVATAVTAIVDREHDQLRAELTQARADLDHRDESIRHLENGLRHERDIVDRVRAVAKNYPGLTALRDALHDEPPAGEGRPPC